MVDTVYDEEDVGWVGEDGVGELTVGGECPIEGCGGDCMGVGGRGRGVRGGRGGRDVLLEEGDEGGDVCCGVATDEGAQEEAE